MKILEVFGEPISNGGQESFVFNVLQHMNLTNLQIDVLTVYYCNNERYRKMIENLNGYLYTLELPFAPGKSRGNILKPVISFLKDNRYDVVHIHSGSISVLALAALAAKKCKVKRIIVHSHASGDKKNLKYKITKTVMTPILSYCPTDYCACSVEAAMWKFPSSVLSKVKIINNGVDLENFAFDSQTRKEMRSRYNINEDTLVLGHVGRFSHEKNQIFLIDLLDMYLKNHQDSHVIMVLLGEGNDKTLVEKRAKELKRDSNVMFPTEYDRARDYLQMFDIFLFPSLFEGLGIVGIEAQAAGLPVIASINVPQKMQITENVKFIPLEDKNCWCEAIDFYKDTSRLNQNDQIRNKGFDITDTAKMMRELYEI